MAQLLIAFVIDARGIVEEPRIALDIPGIEPRDLGAQVRFVVRMIEAGAIGPVEPVEGADRHQRHVAIDRSSRKPPQFLKAIRIGDDGGAGIEGEAVTQPEIGAAAWLVARLAHGRRDAGRLQPDRQRQTAEARADHRHPLRHDTPPSTTLAALPNGTGGLPQRMRALSRLVDRAA